MKYDEQKAIGEGYRNLKHYLRKLIFEDFKVTVDDQQTLEHYFMTQDTMDRYICKTMEWKYEK